MKTPFSARSRFAAALCAALICALGALAGGCRQKAAAPPSSLAGTYRFNTGILVNGKSFSAQVEKLDEGNWQMTFTDPPSLNGVTVRYRDGTAEVLYGGIRWEVPSDVLPDTGVPESILNALEDLRSRTDLSVREEEDHIVYSGNSDSGKFDIYVDKQTDLPVYVKIPKLGLEFSVEDFVQTGKSAPEQTTG